MDGKWRPTGEQVVYDNEWTTVTLVDVELPDGSHIDHHMVTQPKHRGAASVLTYVEGKGVLLIWRHRFITDKWTWELPSGAIEQKESAVQAAGREMFEETGWRPGKLEPMFEYQPMPGLVNHPHYCFYSTEATWEGPAPDANEAADISWTTLDELRELIKRGEMSDGFSLSSVLFALSLGPLADLS